MAAPYYAGPPVAPNALPASLRYWFTYCAQFNNAPGGNVLHLFQNQLAIPLNTPHVGGPPHSQPAPYNGPFLISYPKTDNRPRQQKHPNRTGAGVFLGFLTNNSNNPLQWWACYGRVIRPRRRLGRGKVPQPQLRIYARPRNYTNQSIVGGRTAVVTFQSVSTIQSLRGQTEAQVRAYVDQSNNRDIENHPGEYDSQLMHLRALQRAHVVTLPVAQRQALVNQYGI
jgi:hypothetical protein